MPTLRFEIVVAQPIDRVWAAFQDITELLPALTPPRQGLMIESAEPLPPRLGTTVTMSVRGPFGRVKWTAKYVNFRPPQPTVTGVEAHFADEQISGPFKRWQQWHEFEAASDRTTRCIDVIDYTPPLGPVGWLGDWLFLRWQIRRLFRHRHAVMSQRFGAA